MKKIIKNRDFPSRVIGGELYMVDPKSNTLHNLNSFGTLIWGILDQVSTLDGIIEKIEEEFDVEDQVLRRDLLEFLSELEGKNLIRLC